MSRKFGIEIEATGVQMAEVAAALNAAGIRTYVEGYNHSTKNHWKIVTDASLSGQYAFELVSPILQGADGLCQVDTVGKVLTAIGAKVNKSCGLHVHVDARDITNEQIKRVCKMWMKYESCFDSVMPESRKNNAFCMGIRTKYATLDAAFKAIDAARNLGDLRVAMNGVHGHPSRYHKLNLESLLRHGTVEFRQHSGTVEAAKMLNWVELVTAFVDCAVTAKTIRATGADKFENLMAVTPVPSVRKFYRERRDYFAGATA
jgi:hypothetical protein